MYTPHKYVGVPCVLINHHESCATLLYTIIFIAGYSLKFVLSTNHLPLFQEQEINNSKNYAITVFASNSCGIKHDVDLMFNW